MNNDAIDTTAADTRDAMIAATARRLAATPKFIMNDFPADRSRNNRRGYRTHKRRILK